MEPTILIVDDKQEDLILFQGVLEQSGCRVFTALDSRAALEWLEGQQIDLLLTDISMSATDGFPFLRRARAVQPGIAILVMADYSTIHLAIRAVYRGVDGLVMKQRENTAELVRVVNQTLDESLTRRETARLHALRPLFDITEQLFAESDPDRLEDLIVHVILRTFRAVYAAMYCRDAKTGDLRPVRAIGTVPPLADVDAIALLAEQTCAWGASAVMLPRASLDAFGWDSCLAAPVQRRDDYVLFASRAPGLPQFSEADLEMFVILCRQSVMVLEYARLYEERNAHLRRLEESNQALIQTEKMAAVGRLVASLAHEINNPLQAVRNGLHLAMRDEIDSEKRHQYLSMTNHEVDRLVETVQRMLEVARSGQAKPAPVDIHHSTETVLQLLDLQLRQQDIAVQQTWLGEAPCVLAVPGQIEQVLLNVLINAMDALEEGAGSAQHEKTIWIQGEVLPERVCIAIEDSGPGIRAGLGSRVFEPFVSTKQHGTGLGLSVSYEIITRHGGTMEIASPVHGAGACFVISLPHIQPDCIDSRGAGQ